MLRYSVNIRLRSDRKYANFLPHVRLKKVAVLPPVLCRMMRVCPKFSSNADVRVKSGKKNKKYQPNFFFQKSNTVLWSAVLSDSLNMTHSSSKLEENKLN